MKKSISIIGGGPSALLLAAFLDNDQFDVTIYEKNKSVARKFLVAGKGGFNLTHSEPIDAFIQKYTPSPFLKAALLAFDNEDLREWLKEIGIPTFIGSSKRVYPEKGIKPIEVLNAILAALARKGVRIQYGYKWTAWTENNQLKFENGQAIQSDFIIFALGGGSWKVTGSDGGWLDLFTQKTIGTALFQAANCAYQVNWPSSFINKNEGKPLKNIAIHCGGKVQKGEVVITKFGLEGNAIYALSPQIQQQLNQQNKAIVFVDLKPDVPQELLRKRLLTASGKTTDVLRKTLNLNPTQVNLIKTVLSKDEYLNSSVLSERIKQLPLTILSAAPLDEAISTTGGICLDEVTAHYELKQLDRHFCIGEMLDWNAPTGGYLLQACFSMGVYVARYLNAENRVVK